MEAKTSSDMCNYSIVIPCYCSGPWLTELVDRIDVVMRARNEPFEIVLVNDASPDNTWDVIREVARRYPCVRGIDLQFNTGQHRATLCGLEHTCGDLIILMDDDMQHLPEELPKLIDTMVELPDTDCVMAEFSRKHHGVLRNAGSRLWLWIAAKMYGIPPGLRLSSFRVLKRQLAETLCLYGTVSPLLGPLIGLATRRVVNVTVQHNQRIQGKSGYSLVTLVRMTLDNVFGASTFPLRLVSLLGVSSAAGSVALGAYYLVRYVLGQIAVPGFMTQVLLTMFFGGMILFSVGLVGEYLIRIINEVRRPPRYVVRETTGAERKPT